MRGRGSILAAAAAVLVCGATPAAASASAPVFTNHAGPLELATASGEPSIGFNPKTGQAFFQANTNTIRVDFSTPSPTWTDVSAPNGVISLDPILWTDQQTGRTFASQLLLFCSAMAFTDDDGESWTPSQGCGVGTLVDHQTVGGGPFAEGAGIVGGTGIYPNAVYYCAQAVASAQCAISRDGGLTFGPGVSIYTSSDCAGLHGHLKVGPDGAAYVPNSSCGAEQALVVSRDNGTTWTVEHVPGATSGREADPHLGIGRDGTLYFGHQGGDSGETHPMISVKPAGGTWREPVDVGAPFGLMNMQFPEVIAGDDDRAAFAFLGTKTDGDDQAPDFEGEWHLYVALTYDQGKTWTTVDATPTDPVQRGCIWMGGVGSDTTCRNLLDFNDITVDDKGRVLAAYADGCLKRCVTAATDVRAESRARLGTIARQSEGLGLYSRFDPPGAVVPGRTGAPGLPGSPSCADPLSAARVSGRATRLSFSFEGAASDASIFRESRGRTVSRATRVARLAGVRSGAAVGVKRLAAGIYTARFASTRVGFEVTRSGRVRALGPIAVGRSCGAIRSVSLRSPAFGGSRRAPMKVSAATSEAGELTVQVLRGSKVVHTSAPRTAAAGATTTVNLGALPKLRRGAYKVRVSLRAGNVGHSATVAAVKV